VDPSLKLRQFTTISKSKVKDVKLIQCNCVCRAAKYKNRGYAEDVKDQVAKQLGLSIDDTQQEAVE
jgi:hypothetical protein